MKKYVAIIVAILVSLLLAGCAIEGLQKTLPKKGTVHKGVRTRISRALLLYPVPIHERTVYIKLTNRSYDKKFSQVIPMLEYELTKRDFKVVHSPAKANFKVYVDIRFLGITTLQDAYTFLIRGFGDHVLPAGVGALSFHEVKLTSSDGNFAYTSVVDLEIEQRARDVEQSIHRHRRNRAGIDWYDYWQRIVLTYRYPIYPPKFGPRLQNAFNESIALQIGSVF